MKIGFYPKLAADGIRKNKRIFTPFLLTSSGMVMMFYIITFLCTSDTVRAVRGGQNVVSILRLGCGVIGVFACIFLFYTNSFLVRRRKKEFGLYNILGMGKGSIARIVFWETLIIAGISLIAGLAAGILFSKLAELGLVRLMNGKVTYSLSVSVSSIVVTAAVFAGIFLLLFLSSVSQVRFTNAIDLLRSDKAGEKAPKANYLLGIGGLVLLVIAYIKAITVKNPIEAIPEFFIAVLMVIVATYLIMIFGSVVMCRLLRNNKNYYYKASHFVSVSSMTYRMKRNGAGLASVCILATMVLVMISSTSCLFFGEEEALLARYPGQINLETRYNADMFTEETRDTVRNIIEAEAKEYGTEIIPVTDIAYCTVSGLAGKDGTIITEYSDETETALGLLTDIYFLSAEEYEKETGEKLNLSSGEAMILVSNCDYDDTEISFDFGASFRVVDRRKGIFEPLKSPAIISNMAAIYVFVDDVEAELARYGGFYGSDDAGSIRLCWDFSFDTELDEDGLSDLNRRLLSAFSEEVRGLTRYYSVSNREEERNDFYGLNGGLFYLGIMLSAVFIIAAVLIIYYKQVSEGYEDQARFGIMRNVGMTKHDIRKSINSQLLTVFYLPLVFAALHIVFAFPMIRRLLMLFSLDNIGLFATTTCISFAVFAVFYAVVYKITSNAYYKIVSTDENKY